MKMYKVPPSAPLSLSVKLFCQNDQTNICRVELAYPMVIYVRKSIYFRGFSTHTIGTMTKRV